MGSEWPDDPRRGRGQWQGEDDRQTDRQRKREEEREEDQVAPPQGSRDPAQSAAANDGAARRWGLRGW